MSGIKVDIDADDKPANFPSSEEILIQWEARFALAQAADPRAHIRGVSLVDASGEPYAWLKFGPTVAMSEARTQHYVAQEVNRNAAAPARIPYVYLAFEHDNEGFIAMEYIDGAAPGLNDRDLADAAAAIQFLVTLRAPDLVPGPIGGGLIRHPFFHDRESAVVYPTVGWLELHINRILYLKYRKAAPRVNLSSEIEAYGLRLCPADFNRENFKRDSSSKMVVLDFGATCFLPVSFLKVAFSLSYDSFMRNLGMRIGFPESKCADAVTAAAHALIPYGKNTAGLPRELMPMSR